MFIKVEDTPNPASVKFSPGFEILQGASMQFDSLQDCKDAPLAAELLQIEGVKSLFFAQDFVTVTKDAKSSWDVLKNLIIAELTDYFANKRTVFNTQKANFNTPSSNQEYGDDVINKIVELIDTRVRPLVAKDGGDIVFHDFSDGVVFLEMHGACSGCPSALMTLKSGVENMLKYYVPEVLEVRAV